MTVSHDPLIGLVEVYTVRTSDLVILRDAGIRKEFDGRNTRMLADRYGLHPRQIRRIVHPRAGM